jgi:phenylacetate-CoA ligase
MLRLRGTGVTRYRTVLNMHMTPKRLATELRAWRYLHPYILLAYPSMLEWMSLEIEERGFDVPAPPAAVVAMSETLSPGLVTRVSRVLRSPVHGRYGSNEFSRLAPTLPGTLRYAFNPFLAYMEVISDDGSPTQPGQVGRIVLTDLNNYVMPFIRYDIGDLARVSEEGWAGGFRIVEEIMGRTTDVIRLPSGRLVGVITLHNILFRSHRFEPYIDAYQCAQTAPNAIQLRIVWRRAPDNALRDAVVSAIAPFMDPDTRVSVTDIPQVERLPSGKSWVVRREF